MPTPETLENILIQFTQHQFSMFPTESAIDQFLPPSGFLGFHSLQEGSNSLVVIALDWKSGDWGSIPRWNKHEHIFISDW